ncbi:transmembrane protein C2orf18 [Salpingoeca rosetta]|uniref:Transmembrane protein C2orf18 n=1 Tax=Salpingoeca rosetta (strain ATCC 50818 / BSB-021) TaxID=946362 RepID=F2U8Y4_SALR5|nr:transmembrane protein C2orf18 [Salpingoeca rosetta]EGD73187.1 transmembrane protein C2orf18 [Salpingoeca rosetta]|eukprot:XP_004994218.1 transmembrane protein C2orf18 [Salpingoeca rosetta]
MQTPYHFFLAMLMLVSGSINTITTKYADITCGYGVPYFPRDQSASDNSCPDRSEGQHVFDHPFVQALAMFIGEFTCLCAFVLGRWWQRCRGREPPKVKDFNPIIFLLPALCDCTATSTMYVGLTLTFASQFQMLRGSVIIFTGLLSRFWLKKPLKGYQWAGMVLVLAGLVCVGLAAFFSGASGAQARNPILGDALIIAAQLVVAVQMVVEEKFLTKYEVPALLAVGWEGVFGLLVMSTLSMIFFYIPGPRAGGTFENINDAIVQIFGTWQIGLAIGGTICSIAVFNFSGISVTKEMSATTRMVLDSVRTLTIWAYGLGVGWETFAPLQIVGFALLLLGTFVYNNLLIVPLMRKYGILRPEEPEAKERLIADNTYDEKQPLLVNRD